MREKENKAGKTLLSERFFRALDDDDDEAQG